MTVGFDSEADEYRLTLTPREAHLLVWGGDAAEYRGVKSELLGQLRDVEDARPDEWYARHFNPVVEA